MKTATVLFMVIFCLQAFAETDDTLKLETDDWLLHISGTYEGTLFAAGYNMPVTTNFRHEDGVLVGDYIMDEEGTYTPGLLIDITMGEDRTIHCTWVDIYGSGPAQFTFTSDCSSFIGYWMTEDDPTQGYEWWGSKQPKDAWMVLDD